MQGGEHPDQTDHCVEGVLALGLLAEASLMRVLTSGATVAPRAAAPSTSGASGLCNPLGIPVDRHCPVLDIVANPVPVERVIETRKGL